MLKFLDIGDKFLKADKTLSKDDHAGFPASQSKGYEIWADAIFGAVKGLMGAP